MENNPKYMFVDEVYDIDSDSFNQLSEKPNVIVIGTGISMISLIGCASAVSIYLHYLKEEIIKINEIRNETVLIYNTHRKDVDFNISVIEPFEYYDFIDYYEENPFLIQYTNIEVQKGFKTPHPRNRLARCRL